MTSPDRRFSLRGFLRDTRGVQMIEFAYALPMFLGVGLGCLEIANLSIARTRISQIGASVGDNAARAGQNNGMALTRMFESDVADTFEAARIQGTSINFRERGRVILSSLQQNAGGGQWIAWQRCYGNKVHASTYGAVGQGKTGTAFPGMGPASARITAVRAQDAIMFVEIAYDYRPLIQPFAEGLQYFGLRVNNQVITYKQAFIVREPRELGDSAIASTTADRDFGLFQNNPAVTRQVCPLA